MLPIGKQVGKYRLVRLLGRGGAGCVYEAAPVDGGEPVALKVLPEGVPREGIARFRREMEILRTLQDPHVVGYVEGDPEHTPPYMAMQLVAGEPLAELIGEDDGEEREFPLTATFTWARHIARALAAGHRRGVMHRDLKPQNIMIDAANRAILIDFGLGKGEEATALTGTGEFLGTMAYASPEHLKGPMCPASDVYQWGLVVHQMLTGKLPYAHETPMTAMRHRLGRGVQLELAVDEPLAGLVALVNRALTPDPSLRPADGVQLVQLLSGIAGAPKATARITMPIGASQATSSSASSPASKPVRASSRVIVAALVLGILALIGILFAMRTPI